MKISQLTGHLVMNSLLSLMVSSPVLSYASVSPDATTENSICIGIDCQPDENPLENYKVDLEESNSDSVAEYIQAEIISAMGEFITVQNLETGEIIDVSRDNGDIDITDAEGILVDSINQAKYLILPNFYFPSMAQKFAGQSSKKSPSKLKRWSECVGKVLGRYSGSRSCSKSSRVMHPSLYDVLMKLPRLVGSSKVFIVHKGISGDSNHKKRKSLHNSFKAVDIDQIKVGNKIYDYRKAAVGSKSERKFYNNLLSKWESAVRKRCGGVVAATTINWTNSKHRHHVHLGTTYNCR